MGNVSEFQKAYQLVISRPSFDIDVNTSVFEANIRGYIFSFMSVFDFLIVILWSLLLLIDDIICENC